MKITKENIKKILFPFIENNRLEELLSKKWWHRLLVVLFSLVIITGVIASILLPIVASSFDQDLNFLSGIFFWLSSMILFYIFILIIQFIYFHVFLYIIYGNNSNILISLKKIFKNIGFSIILLLLFGAIIYFTASIVCDKDRMFYSVQKLSFVCECNAGYREDNYCYKAKIPENAYECISDSGWCCDYGYYESGEKCIINSVKSKFELK